MLLDLIEIERIIRSEPYEPGNCNDVKSFLSMIHGTKCIYTTNEIYDICNDKALNIFLPIVKKQNQLCIQGRCNVCNLKKYCIHYIKKIQDAEQKALKPVFVDFFCGAGGLSLGFIDEGYKLSFANDIQECCIDTYSFNHPETPKKHIICGDINDVIRKIADYKRFEKTDVVIGGPPCQGFSMANRQRIIDDPRNHLYKSYIEAIKILCPKFVVMENVKGMLKVEKQIKEDFGNIGYIVSAHILNAKDFGVPQNRTRVIFIGNNMGIDNEVIFNKIFSMAVLIPKTTLEDALFGLTCLHAKKIRNRTDIENDEVGYTIKEKKWSSENDYINLINSNRKLNFVLNHKSRYNNERDIEIFGRLNQGDRSDDSKIADIMPYKRRNGIFKDKYYKLQINKPCKTITAHMKYDCNMYIHPNQARGLTPREAARIQSYPDDYFFRGPYTKTYMQVGNSVPPLLSRVIAKAIKDFI